MLHSPRPIRRLSALLLAVLPFLSGCLHYDERGTIATDGSGELRVVYSMGPGGELDKEKQAEVRSGLVATEGIEIVDDIDSTDGDTTWVGMRLRFSSLSALQAIDTILPLKGMFQGVALRQDEEGTWIFSRSVRLPPTPTEGMDMPRFRQILTWVVPGRVLHADTLARWSEGDNTVVWTLPNDGSAGPVADLEVRWIDGDVVRLALPWKWIGIGAGGLVFVILLLLLVRNKARKPPTSPASSGSDATAGSSTTPSRSEPAPSDAASSPVSVDFATPVSPPESSAPSPDDPSGVAATAPVPTRRSRFWPRYFLSPSLFLAAFVLFALAPVVNVSCMGRTQTMTGWELSYRSPDPNGELGAMLDMAETMEVQTGFEEDGNSSLAAGRDEKAPKQTSDATYLLWFLLFSAGVCVVFPWERAQGLAAVSFGGALIWFQEMLGRGMERSLPEVAKYLKIEKLAAWYMVEGLVALAILSGLWSIASSFRGGKARKGWIPSLLALLLFAPVALVMASYPDPTKSMSGDQVDTTAVLELPPDTEAISGESGETEGEPTTPEPFVDSRDDRTYRVVNGPAGPWLGRNLAYVADSSWCFPAPGVDCEREGRLYTWEAAQEVCPAGWRLPTLQEVEQLAGSVGEVALLRAGPVGTEDSDPGMALVATGWGGADGTWNDHGRTISLWVVQPGPESGPFVWQIDAGDRIGTGPASAGSRHGVRCVGESE